MAAGPGAARPNAGCTYDDDTGQSELEALESESLFVFREVAAEFERPVLLFSGGKDSIVMLHLARKAFSPARPPFTLLHVDTGHNFAEVLEYRDRVVAELGLKLEVAQVQDYLADGRLRERPDGFRNQLQTVPLLDAINAGPVRRGVRRRPAGRGEGPGQGAGVQPARRVRPVGPSQPAAGAVVAVQRPAPPGRARPGLPAVELDRVRRLALHRRRGDRPAEHLLRAPARGVRAGRDAAGHRALLAAAGRRGAVGAHGAIPDRRRHVLHGRGGERRRDAGGGRGRGGGERADRTGRHPGRRPGQRSRDGRPQAGGVLLMTTLLRLATAGSVDDGKSTLVGRLLHDCKAILADQIAHVKTVSESRGGDFDFALLTDGLRAEREQGITIDVAYRYFATDTRSYILADCPGHVQYTRNTVTGASTADVVIILVDARSGVVEQTRRHLAVAGLLRVPHVLLAVNKIDLVDYDEVVYKEIAGEISELAARLGIPDVQAIPVSALVGDNVVDRSERTEWYDGPVLLEFLENAAGREDVSDEPFRFPVQYVIRSQRPTSTAGMPALLPPAMSAPATR